MNKYFLLFFIGIFTISCNKDETEKDLNPSHLHGGWDCIQLKSALLTNREVLDKELNSKLSAYTPNIVLDFTSNTCTFYIVKFPAVEGRNTFSYTLQDGQIIYNVKNIEESNDEKIRANIQLKGNKLHMTFNCLDFKNYVYILGKDYPFHKDFLEPTVGGDVTIIFERQVYN